MNNIIKGLKSTYIITGATGFIGSLLTKRLLQTEEYHEGNLKIFCLVRDLEKANNFYRDYDNKNLYFLYADINIPQNIESVSKHLIGENVYFIHCAATTQSSKMISNPIETVDGIVLGTRNMLEMAKELHVKSMVYLSSMEVYGKMENDGSLVTENMLGEIDIFNPRSCYPLGKRLAEHYCFDYHKEYDVPVKIARLAQVFGTGILQGENRVFAQFANATRKNKDIVLHTSGESIGNYCEIMDAVDAIFALLYKGENGEAYNIVNEANTMRIREMAELVADKIADNQIKVVYDIPEGNQYGYAPDTGLRLSAEKLRKLGWEPTKNMEEMYCEMIEWMNKQEM